MIAPFTKRNEITPSGLTVAFSGVSSEVRRYSEQVNQEIKLEKAKEEKESKGTAPADEDIETTHYRIYSPGDGAEIWDDPSGGSFIFVPMRPITQNPLHPCGHRGN